jgi:formate hydrogenlyase subunit 3/multisubunit Na+/H+ antiporter MnhD subunit
MFSLTLNPGFVLLAAALGMLVLPRTARPVLMAGAAIVALWLLLGNEFGAVAAIAQMGLPVILLEIDELNRVFGLAILISACAIAIGTQARVNRYEDAALLMVMGGAVSALFLGDYLSFMAAAAVSSLGVALVAFASPTPDAGRAGARSLVWYGLEGLVFLLGVALHLAAGGGQSTLTRLSADSAGSWLILASLLIRVGAPLAHVWIKDAVAHASPTGAAAISACSGILGVYALARFFPAEPILIPIGCAMIGLGALYILAEDDLRRAGAAALSAQCGVCLVLIGIGDPVAVAAAEAVAFATVLTFAALQLAIGNVAGRVGHARASMLAGAGATAPASTLLLLLAALAASFSPGFISFAALALALDALASWETRLLWALILALAGVVFAGLAVRPFIMAHRDGTAGQEPRHVSYALPLSAIVAWFLCLAMGVAPNWLFGLLSGQLSFDPFSFDRVGVLLQVLGAAGLATALLAAPTVSAALSERAWDVDRIYAGPVLEFANMLGAWFRRGQELTGGAIRRLSNDTLDALGRGVHRMDRPYVSTGVWCWAIVAAIVTLPLFIN